MQQVTSSVRQLTRSFSDTNESDQLLNPDETPEDFGVSVSQLRNLAEVRLQLVSKAVCQQASMDAKKAARYTFKLCVKLQNKSKDSLEELGGLSGLENALKTSINSGLDTHGAANFSVERRQKLFGANKFKEVAQKAFLALFAENLKDPTLVLLMAAALVRHDVALIYFAGG